MESITAQALRQLLKSNPDTRLIDVRTPEEFSSSAIPEAINIPTYEVEQRSAEFKSEQPTYIICRSGARSKLVTLTLSNLGLQNLVNVTGGMLAWETSA